MKVRGAAEGAAELLRGELIGGPDGGFVVRVVAENDDGTVEEFAVGAIASGEAKAVRLGGEDGGEEEKKSSRRHKR